MSAAPCFLVDHMAGKLGAYLRILGYDAAWHRTLRTHELIRRANEEGRVFLTRNRHLDGRYPAPRQVMVLADSNPVRQLEAVVAAFGLEPREHLFRRCIRCNVELRAVAEKAAIRARVHPNVYARHERFYTCPGCGTVFWHGSHVRNTCAKLHLLPPKCG